MAEEAEVGCARPTGGPVVEESAEIKESGTTLREERQMIMVGQGTPVFIVPDTSVPTFAVS